MPVYQLNEEIGFPHPNQARSDGLLAIGGDLSAERLMLAYSMGIFPWFDDESPILWWSPNPRLLIFPEKFKVSKSLKRVLKNNSFQIYFDKNFASVIEHCSTIIRQQEEGTWITSEMKEAYVSLHEKGLAHSVEVYDHEELIGGLYGLSLGKVFFGESMFSKKRDASKIALYYLCQQIQYWDFLFIDAQVETEHLVSLGAEKIKRKEFLNLLEIAQASPTCLGKWTMQLDKNALLKL